MLLSQLLKPDAVMAALRVNGKEQALQEMSERAALISGLPAREIFDALLQRERLGSTGVGDGVAIPHGKLAKCPHIFGVFARLDRPIQYSSDSNAGTEKLQLAGALRADPLAGHDTAKGLRSVLAGFGELDFDPEFDFGQDRIEAGIARGGFQVGGGLFQPAYRRSIEIT